MQEHVLVTGGAGYIGSHVCKALALHGYIPITYDSLITGHEKHVKWGPFIKGDILDKDKLIGTLKQFKITAIFHLASYSNARESVAEKNAYYQNNLMGTQTLLEAMKKVPVPFFIFSSSASVYQTGLSDKLSEFSPLAPLHPYGQTKLLSEELIKTVCEQQGTYYANLRYFNVAGADPEADIGESHFPETHLIPLLIQVLQRKKEYFSLLYHSHDTPDKTAKRDFIHVTDLAKSHLDVLSYLKHHKKNLTLNLGSGQGYSILEVIKALEDRTQKKIPIQKQVSNLQEPASVVADVSLAKTLLSFSPSYSSLPTILDTALQWHGL